MAKGKEIEVKELQPAEQPQKLEAITIDGQEIEGYIQILKLILVGDARLVPIEKHFINMVNRAYENSQKQSE
jgi:hypothetical protein